MSTISGTDGTGSSKALHVGLWVVQVLLGAIFFFGGVLKTVQPVDDLAARLVWPGAVPAALVRFIGVSELLGGLGLILPAATRIKPVLTPLAALGLAAIMLLAAVFHVVRGEFSSLPINFAFGGLAVFVAWGRLKRAPISARRS